MASGAVIGGAVAGGVVGVCCLYCCFIILKRCLLKHNLDKELGVDSDYSQTPRRASDVARHAVHGSPKGVKQSRLRQFSGFLSRIKTPPKRPQKAKSDSELESISLSNHEPLVLNNCAEKDENIRNNNINGAEGIERDDSESHENEVIIANSESGLLDHHLSSDDIKSIEVEPPESHRSDLQSANIIVTQSQISTGTHSKSGNIKAAIHKGGEGHDVVNSKSSDVQIDIRTDSEGIIHSSSNSSASFISEKVGDVDQIDDDGIVSETQSSEQIDDVDAHIKTYDLPKEVRGEGQEEEENVENDVEQKTESGDESDDDGRTLVIVTDYDPKDEVGGAAKIFSDTFSEDTPISKLKSFISRRMAFSGVMLAENDQRMVFGDELIEEDETLTLEDVGVQNNVFFAVFYFS